jgi:DNA-binding NarL/FixJ family response regulator
MEETRMNVLLVDDDEAFRATLRQLLTSRDHAVRVEEAANGEEALGMVAVSPPDVVLMDLTMPRMNGVEATRRLKTRWPDLPVIILTVHHEPVYERVALAAGADGYVLKKTAGTALWPALAPFAERGGRPGHGQAMTESRARQGFDAVSVREPRQGRFRNSPDWQMLPKLL